MKSISRHRTAISAAACTMTVTAGMAEGGKNGFEATAQTAFAVSQTGKANNAVRQKKREKSLGGNKTPAVPANVVKQIKTVPAAASCRHNRTAAHAKIIPADKSMKTRGFFSAAE